MDELRRIVSVFDNNVTPTIGEIITAYKARDIVYGIDTPENKMFQIEKLRKHECLKSYQYKMLQFVNDSNILYEYLSYNQLICLGW
jgi:hypothetical protein